MKKWLLRVAMSVLALLVIAIVSFVVYAQFDYGPSETLAERVDLSALESDGEGLFFQPESPNGQGIILFQGAKVQKEAYAYLGKSLSEQGFVVSIPQLPLNFGILGSGTAGSVMEVHPEVEEWFLGGHSLGGVAASFYAEDPSPKLSGLFFLGAYPASDFSESGLPMLSIYGELDGLSTIEDIEASRELFPDGSIFEEIEGGNHAQFGLYGEQKGDNPAQITAVEQQDQVIEALIEWINKN
ncbi:dienelactone hydrolase [Planomicrobium stackebrandtii]|uniref:Dienelactone hydrolase n=1 Tax=Planomicrobium stackebrandtii TaxID=253160 RepID=A0ABU0GX86_9BACL|nr:alpha/beta hydrolase [Planomicrobium stackebrandtii]MDQ0429683.1 dienelactone hydrolase [Planomicrobium stackebrandtii]